MAAINFSVLTLRKHKVQNVPNISLTRNTWLLQDTMSVAAVVFRQSPLTMCVNSQASDIEKSHFNSNTDAPRLVIESQPCLL